MYCRNADVMKMNLLASFWLRSKCDHPHTGSLSLCVNVYVGISIHRQYTEGLDHKSVLSMCCKARRLQLKGNVRASEWHSCFWASKGEIAELTVSRDRGLRRECSENWARACADCSLQSRSSRVSWHPKAQVNMRAKALLHSLIWSAIFDFLKCL